jgi:uncharacterized protein YfaP (DUF2135 family)
MLDRSYGDLQSFAKFRDAITGSAQATSGAGVQRGQTGGTFASPSRYATGRTAVSLRFGDMDGDSRKDIVFGDGSNSVGILYANGEWVEIDNIRRRDFKET